MTTIRNLLLILLVLALMLSFGWVGYIASDDGIYAMSAQRWLTEGFHVADSHWALRYPFVLTTVASFAAFGVNEAALVGVSLGYWLLAVLIAYSGLRRAFGADAAAVSSALLCTIPFFAVSPSVPGPEMTELLFVAGSLFLVHRALETRATASFFLAGVVAGLAWLTRETSAALLLLYGLLFLFGYRAPRRQYLWLAAGFLMVWGLELAYYLVTTGDPLYRLWVDIDQGRSDPTRIIAKHPGTGNLSLHGSIDTLLALLANQEFMLLYFLAVPAGISLWRRKDLSERQRTLVVLVTGLLVLWVLVVGYLLPVRELPRYFTPATYSAGLLVGLWLYRLAQRHTTLALAIGGAFVLANLLGVYVENKNPIFGERALVSLAREAEHVYHTDPKTLGSSRFLLNAEGLTDRVSDLSPPPNALYVYNPNRVLQDTRPKGYAEQYKPRPRWVELDRIRAPTRLIGTLLEWTKLDRLVPAGLYRKLARPVQDVVIYRVK